MDTNEAPDRRARWARVAAWGAVAYGALVLLAGVGLFLEEQLGPKASGCGQMVGEFLALLVLAFGLVAGVPHLLFGAGYLRRPERWRRWLLGLFALDVLVGSAYAVLSLFSGLAWATVIHVPVALLAGAGFMLVRAAPKPERRVCT